MAKPPKDLALYGEGHAISVVSANDYVNKHARDEDDLLVTIRKYCREMGLPNINPEEGRVLSLLIQTAGFKRILEVGCCSGYSAIWMARALPADGSLETIEMDPSMVRVATENFRKASVDKKVKVLAGKALEVMPKLPEKSYDLVFIDAEKTEYSDYLREALRLVHKGSVICADNVFWQGRVFSDEADDATEAIKYFTKQLFSNQRLKTTLLPVSDGMSWSLVRS